MPKKVQPAACRDGLKLTKAERLEALMMITSLMVLHRQLVFSVQALGLPARLFISSLWCAERSSFSKLESQAAAALFVQDSVDRRRSPGYC
jgi:hypothetical protein